MSYTKEEALRLHEYSEGNQYGWLIRNGVIRDRYVSASQEILCSCGKEGIKRELESLADCAFRLRDEAFNKVGTFVGRCKIFIACKDKDCEIKNCDTWFLHKSKPIHWIMAYLLARLESEGRNE